VPKQRPVFAPSTIPGLLPYEVFDVDRGEVRCHEPRLDGPRQSPFNRGVTEIKTNAHSLRIEVSDHVPDVPDRRPDIVLSGMVLETGFDADLAIERGQILQLRFDLTQLVLN